MSLQQDDADIDSDSIAVPEWLMALIRCPVTGTPLTKAEPRVVMHLQEQAKLGKLRSKNGVSVSAIPSQGLLAAGAWFYPVRNGIPTLIPDEAIAVATTAVLPNELSQA